MPASGSALAGGRGARGLSTNVTRPTIIPAAARETIHGLALRPARPGGLLRSRGRPGDGWAFLIAAPRLPGHWAPWLPGRSPDPSEAVRARRPAAGPAREGFGHRPRYASRAAMSGPSTPGPESIATRPSVLGARRKGGSSPIGSGRPGPGRRATSLRARQA